MSILAAAIAIRDQVAEGNRKLREYLDWLYEEKARKQRAEFEARLARFKKPTKKKPPGDGIEELGKLFVGGTYFGGTHGTSGGVPGEDDRR